MKSIENKKKVALISPEKSAYSATFIKAHINLLDANVEHLYGIFFPTASANGRFQVREHEFVKKVFYKLRLKRTYKNIFLTPPLTEYFRKEKIELAFAEFGPVGAEVYEACKKLNIPLIVHFHGYDAYLHHLLKRYNQWYTSMFAYASYLIVVSEDMKAQLLRLGAPIEKLVLNPYGPNDAFLSIAPTFKEVNFVATGRFVHKKAPHLTIKAFKKVHDHIPHATLKMAGDGPLLEMCKQLVAELNITEAVEFLGATSHQQVVALYQNAYCFVQHSVIAPDGDSEGTPVAILEASAAGLPVVATKHAGIQDVILHGKTGYLVNEHDIDAMAHFMIQLARDTDLAKQIGQKGKERIKENYTMDKHIHVINHLIKSIKP